MNTWKSAHHLAGLEIRASIWQLILFIPLISLLYSLFFTGTMSNYLNQSGGSFMFDVMFLLIISIAPIWLRAKFFQVQKINDEFWASPTLILQHQLAISERAIARSRLISFVYLLIPFNILIFTLTYVLSSHIRAFLTPIEYVIFAISWMLIGLGVGFIFPASDVGDYINRSSIARGIVLLFGGFFIVTVGLFMILNGGIIYSSMIFVKKYSLLALLISIIFVCLSALYWQRYMIQAMRKLDYF
ncbi:MAG TPA: hypothetical protein VK125_04540 [Bacillota bacterium]|nr:hypothetical protein [Bacillota bacterium]